MGEKTYSNRGYKKEAWKWFRNGTINFREVLCFLLPWSFLRRLPWSFRLPSKNTVMKLFGNPFLVPMPIRNVSAFFDGIKSIIFCNQYHVELIHDGVIVDAGANMGIFSVFVAIKHPNATILAFEPTPLIFEALQENVKYYPNIKAFNCGLGEKQGKASLVINDRFFSSNHIGEGGIPVDIQTIDGLNTRVDFLKIDTEGYEANILKGATETIRKWKPVIAMSAYHKPEDKTELPALLNSIAPYDCELWHNYEDDFICTPLP